MDNEEEDRRKTDLYYSESQPAPSARSRPMHARFMTFSSRSSSRAVWNTSPSISRPSNPRGGTTFICSWCSCLNSVQFIAIVPGCNHQFCRACLLSYMKTWLEQGRTGSIPCPSLACTLPGGGRRKGVIVDSLAQSLGLTQEEFNIFQKRQIQDIAQRVLCQGCRRHMYVDRADYAMLQFVTCPLPKCNHTWCKRCLRRVKPREEARHVCLPIGSPQRRVGAFQTMLEHISHALGRKT
ncbi:hypothetical protein BDN72DRAFT_851234 [Pluteus cervinus]|uniref:Uncharacterized protein n=1 Tax=Pluteus cervinus TaxID=181527 RepID=A0ACD3A2D2_9AGAR|nr:hypothetical protein BDN72DRAFT_851234 [Pluteus cervinus]